MTIEPSPPDTMMNEPLPTTDIARRTFLGTGLMGLGSIALSGLMARSGHAFPVPGRTAGQPFKLGKATAKRVIMIFAAGGLSQHDPFDEKPPLNKRRGEALPDS